jgi:hypothetical protein
VGREDLLRLFETRNLRCAKQIMTYGCIMR